MTKVLVVVTNHSQFGDLDRATGLWLSESVHFQAVMAQHNVAVDYVSPAGGYVPVDPLSLQDMDATTWSYYSRRDFQNTDLGQTLAPADVTPSDYAAIYFAGGHGVLWDFPENPQLAALAEAIYTQGGIVSAVCHGVVGLLGVKANGRDLIAGKNVTGFSNEEEAMNQLTTAVPFLAEDRLKATGANYAAAAAYTENVVVDGRLITGQNPQSAKGVGEAVWQQLKEA